MFRTMGFFWGWNLWLGEYNALILDGDLLGYGGLVLDLLEGEILSFLEESGDFGLYINFNIKFYTRHLIRTRK